MKHGMLKSMTMRFHKLMKPYAPQRDKGTKIKKNKKGINE